MNTLEEERQKAVADRENEVTKFKTERARLTDEQAELKSKLDKMRMAANVKVKDAGVQVDELKKRIKELTELIDRQADIIAHVTNKNMPGSPSGEIVQVDRGSSTVWINLGRADSLSQQVSFSVFPADLSNLKLEGNKGSIEVTHVLGDHLSEARVTDDRIADPILPGDKLYTPLWNPGQKRHFALAGFFNIDGRPGGQSDLHTVINLLKANRCAVDCYIEDNGDDKNEQVGKITPNTNYLVLGTPPDDKADPRQVVAFSNMPQDGRPSADSHHAVQRYAPGDGLEERRADYPLRAGNGFQRLPSPAGSEPAAEVGGQFRVPQRQPPKPNSGSQPAAGSNGSSYIHY